MKRIPGQLAVGLLGSALVVSTGHAAPPPAQITAAQAAQRGLRPMLQSNLERPLRCAPDGGDFAIVNGEETFNRPLYGGSSQFRVDAGDRPEFSFYLPGRGGNLRLGLAAKTGMKWLPQTAHIEARYRGGTMASPQSITGEHSHFGFLGFRFQRSCKGRLRRLVQLCREWGAL